jgi:DNA invertase Pin-like site-specific DNA recombinase
MSYKKYIAYYRVSTSKQEASGLGLEAQYASVRSHTHNGKLIAEHEEIESGKVKDRPALLRALKDCRIHNATLVIAKLDRLARSVSFISKLMEESVDFVAVDMPHANKLTVHILAAMAEHEREMISTRTKAALAAAKKRGVKLGGRRGNHNIGDYANKGASASSVIRSLSSYKKAMDRIDAIEDIKASGTISFNGIANALNQRGIPTVRSGKWSATQVSRILKLNKNYICAIR